jgi:hypothetical protein
VHLSWFAHLQLMISEKWHVIEEIWRLICNQHKKIFQKHVISFGAHNFFVNLLTSVIFNMKNTSTKQSNTKKCIKNAFEVYLNRSCRNITPLKRVVSTLVSVIYTLMSVISTPMNVVWFLNSWVWIQDLLLIIYWKNKKFVLGSD